MDFATMETRLRGGLYPTLDAFAADFRLICSNCMLYNPEDSDFYKEAATLLVAGNKLIDAEDSRMRREEETRLARQAMRAAGHAEPIPANDAGDSAAAAEVAAPPAAGAKRARSGDPATSARPSVTGPALPQRRLSGARASKTAAAGHLTGAAADDSATEDEWDSEGLPRARGVGQALPHARARASGRSPHAAKQGSSTDFPSAAEARKAAPPVSKRQSAVAAADHDCTSSDDEGVSALAVRKALRGITVHVAVRFQRGDCDGAAEDSMTNQQSAVVSSDPIPEDYDPEEDAWVCAVCDDGSADALGNALVQCGACGVVVHQASARFVAVRVRGYTRKSFDSYAMGSVSCRHPKPTGSAIAARQACPRHVYAALSALC